MPPRPADPPPSPAQNRMPYALSGAHSSSSGEASPSSSTHGEKLVPTPQDSYDPGFAEEPSGRQVSDNPSSGVFSQNYASSDDDFDSDASDSSDEESSSAPSAYNSNTEFVDAEQQQDIEGDDDEQVNNSEDFVGSDDGEDEDDVFDDEGGIDGTKENPRYSPFPSVGLLIFLAVFIALSAIGLAAGLTVYLWQNKYTDPIRPPDGQVPPGFETEPPVNPFLPSDERLLFMFSKVTEHVFLYSRIFLLQIKVSTSRNVRETISVLF